MGRVYRAWSLLPSRTLVSLALGAVVACGGAEVSDLFAPSTAASSTEDGGGSLLDSAASPDTAPSGEKDGGVLPRSDGGKPDKDGGNGKPDVFVPPPFDAGPLLGNDAGIYCDGVTDCNVGQQYCCAGSNGGGKVTFDCKANVGSSCTGTRIECDDVTDCPSNQYCCGNYENKTYAKLECRANALCGLSTPTVSVYRFCDPNAPVDECVAIGKTCSQQSTALPGLYFCS